MVRNPFDSSGSSAAVSVNKEIFSAPGRPNPRELHQRAHGLPQRLPEQASLVAGMVLQEDSRAVVQPGSALARVGATQPADGDEVRARRAEHSLGPEPGQFSQGGIRAGSALVVREVADVLPQHEFEGRAPRRFGWQAPGLFEPVEHELQARGVGPAARCRLAAARRGRLASFCAIPMRAFVGCKRLLDPATGVPTSPTPLRHRLITLIANR
jgi:hypothetical protein